MLGWDHRNVRGFAAANGPTLAYLVRCLWADVMERCGLLEGPQENNVRARKSEKGCSGGRFWESSPRRL